MLSTSPKSLFDDLQKFASEKRKKASMWFFKTGKGEYGEGDKFIGVSVPDQRKIAKKYKDLDLKQIAEVLKSKVHEHRLTALFILSERAKKSKDKDLKSLVDFYLRNLKFVNNWDLVDSSAPYILGKYLADKPREILYKLASSKDLWQKRVSVISTGWLIKIGQYDDTIKISEMLVPDQNELIHKAVGWMLREVGKKSRATEEKFLDKYAATMPRTMLRYAVEKFPVNLKNKYMNYGKKN